MAHVLNRVGGGSGEYPSVFFYGDDLTSAGSVTMTGQGKTYNGVWTSRPILPSEYQEVEYIESSGTQYIDTGVNADSNKSIEIDLQFTSATALTTPFGARSSKYWEVVIDSGATAFYWQYNGSYDMNVGTADTNRHTMKVENGSFYFDGTLKRTVSGTFDIGYNLVLFANNKSGTAYRFSSVKMYSCKIYNGSTLVRDFVPCYRISDDVIGLYDLVNDVFYDNDGTGVFTKGNNVTHQGFLVDKIKAYGTYTYTATQGSSTKTGSILVDAVEDYSVEISYVFKLYSYGQIASGHTFNAIPSTSGRCNGNNATFASDNFYMEDNSTSSYNSHGTYVAVDVTGYNTLTITRSMTQLASGYYHGAYALCEKEESITLIHNAFDQETNGLHSDTYGQYVSYHDAVTTSISTSTITMDISALTGVCYLEIGLGTQGSASRAGRINTYEIELS